VLSGADAGDVQTIASVSQDGNGNYTIFNLAGNWAITPATGDIVVICAPTEAPEYPSARMTVQNGSVSGVMVQPNVSNLALQLWLFMVRTETTAGAHGPDALVPMREVYLFGMAIPTVLATANITLTGGQQNVDADATAGGFTVTLPPFAGWIGQNITITKMDSTANVVTWQLATGDTIPGIGNTGTITAQGSSITITATQA
jgi:hypothetical protein